MDEPCSSRDNTNVQPRFLFTELTSLDELSFPASSSKRIKFTCVAASSRHLALGTSSGTVYVFSRFRPKSKNGRSSLPPVEVFTTKDGSISRIQISPDEQNVAVGGDSGRISVAALAANGLSTSIVYTSPGDPRKTDRVTGLRWSRDSKLIFASHMSGSVIEHKLTQSVFRTSSRQLCQMESEVVQLEISETGKQLLVSTMTSSFVYDVESRSTSQVGKKTRNSRMGACFVSSASCEFIAASRPNGRLWEANSIGVVYRTHQFRQSPTVPRFSIASYRSSFKGSQRSEEAEELETAANEDVQLFLLNTIQTSSSSLLLSAYGSKLLVFDSESSQVILVTDLGKEILQYTVCGSDVFAVLNTSVTTTACVKLTLLTTAKAVEKLQLRGCSSQAAEIVTKTIGIEWSATVLKGLLEDLESRKKEKNSDMLRSGLLSMLDRMELNESTYDNEDKNEVSKKLPSGVHRVLCQPTVSGFEDDFTLRFTSPLKERSRSSPTVDVRQSLISTVLVKQNSMPLTAEEVEVCSRNGTPDVTEQDILERARTILEGDGHVIEADSLRTLLQFDLPTTDLRFTPQVTVANAAKALADLATVTPLDVSSILTVDRRVNASGTRRTGPTIVKPVRRQVSRPAVAPKASLTIKSPPMERNSNIITPESPDRAEKLLVSDDQNNMGELETEWLERRINEAQRKTENGEKCQNSMPSTSSESESVTTTESGKELLGQGETDEDSDHCRHCGIHRSWIGLTLLASVCKRVTVEKSELDSVPKTPSIWVSLFRRKLSDSYKEAKICPRCEAAFATVAKLLSGLPKSSGLIPSGQKIDANTIRERIRENGMGRLETICKSSPTESKVVSQEIGSTVSSIDSTLGKTSTPPVSSSLTSPTLIEPVSLSKETEGDFHWLNRVDIMTLLFLCYLVLGYKGLLSLLKENIDVAEKLQSDHWSTLVSLAIRDQQMRRDLVGSQVAKEVLDSLRLSLFLSIPSGEKAPSPRASISRRAAPHPIYSWIVDSSGACLICTLSLQTQVKGEELMLTSFHCGHTYHSKCLSGKTYCVACRVRARKMSALNSPATQRAAVSRPIKK